MTEISKYFESTININGTETIIVKKGLEESFLKSETFGEYFSDNIIKMLLYIPTVCNKYNLRFGILRLKTNYKTWNIAVLCMLIDGEFHHVFYKENWLCRECRHDNGRVLMPFVENGDSVMLNGYSEVPKVFTKKPCKNCGKILQNHIMFLENDYE